MSHYWDGEGAFVLDSNQYHLHYMQFMKKELSPNHLCLQKKFLVCECKSQFSSTVHRVLLSSP